MDKYGSGPTGIGGVSSLEAILWEQGCIHNTLYVYVLENSITKPNKYKNILRHKKNSIVRCLFCDMHCSRHWGTGEDETGLSCVLCRLGCGGEGH